MFPSAKKYANGPTKDKKLTHFHAKVTWRSYHAPNSEESLKANKSKAEKDSIWENESNGDSDSDDAQRHRFGDVPSKQIWLFSVSCVWSCFCVIS